MSTTIRDAYPVAGQQQRECRLIEPGRFGWGESAVPSPGEGEVLIRPQAVGVCGTDYHAFDGKQNFFTYPRVLGHEIGAEVVALGKGCEDAGLKPGDKVGVVPYWECGKCVACRWGKPNCCTSISVIGVHADGGMREYLCAPKNKLVKSDKLRSCPGRHTPSSRVPRRAPRAP